MTDASLSHNSLSLLCLAGIRCERATALLNQMSTANPDLKPKGVYHMRGGIERYVKSFPKGGFWKGKNYLFDRRMEQVPGTKEPQEVEQEVDSKCCLCRRRWTYYRGKFKCSQSLCGVPVIVCTECDTTALRHPERLTCELCKEGYKAPEAIPDLVALKRKAEALIDDMAGGRQHGDKGDTKRLKDEAHTTKVDPKRLFLSKLPLVISKSKLEEVLGKRVIMVHWLTDRNSRAFYGSCMVELENEKDGTDVIDRIKTNALKIEKKKIKVAPVTLREGDVWPPEGHLESEFPPIGH